MLQLFAAFLKVLAVYVQTIVVDDTPGFGRPWTYCVGVSFLLLYQDLSSSVRMTQQLKEFTENLGTLLEEYDNLQRELACYREDLQEMQEAWKRVRDENNILWDMLPQKESEVQSCGRCEE